MSKDMPVYGFDQAVPISKVLECQVEGEAGRIRIKVERTPELMAVIEAFGKHAPLTYKTKLMTVEPVKRAAS